MLELNIKAKSCNELYEEFSKKRNIVNAEILKFDDVGSADVYNPSLPFELNSEIIMAGRVEMRDTEISEVLFFIESEDGVWRPHENSPRFVLKDPFISMIKDEWILGGYRNIYLENEKGSTYRSCITYFHRGNSLDTFKAFLSGPYGMKDIRLIELDDGRIGVFSRPKGKKYLEKYGVEAAIGFDIVDSLEDVTTEVILNAPPLEGLFLSDEWGGCNQLYLLKNGLIGVVGHISCKGSTNHGDVLNYYAMVFAIDPNTKKRTPCKIICSRDCFPKGPAKRADLKNVTFIAGIIRENDGTATLYTGLNDCQVGRCIIPDPFLEYEIL